MKWARENRFSRGERVVKPGERDVEQPHDALAGVLAVPGAVRTSAGKPVCVEVGGVPHTFDTHTYVVAIAGVDYAWASMQHVEVLVPVGQ